MLNETIQNSHATRLTVSSIPKFQYVRKFFAVLFSLAFTLALAACGGSSSGNDSTQNPGPGDVGDEPSPPVATSIEVSEESLSQPLIVGQSAVLTVSVLNDDGAEAETVSSDFEWAVEDETVATISSDGRVQALSPGASIITAAYENLSANIEVEVLARAVNSLELVLDRSQMPLGTSSMVRVFGIYNDETREQLDANDSILIDSSDTLVAQLDSSVFGRVVSTGVGLVTITATSDSGISNSSSIEITPAVIISLMVSSDSLVAPAGFPVQLSARGTYTDGSQQSVTSDVNWSVSGIDGAQISSSGVLSSDFPGLASAVAELGGESSSIDIEFTDAILESIEIVAGDASLPAGRSGTVSLRGAFSNETQRTVDADEWSSSDLTILTIDEHGSVAALSEGTVTVTASLGELTTEAQYTVTSAILEQIDVSFVNTSVGSLSAGLQTNSKADATFSDGSQSDLTGEVVWASSDSNVAAIGASGTVTAKIPGTVNISATYGDISGSTTLIVTDAILESVSIDADSLVSGEISGAKGLMEAVTLLGIFSDGSESILAADEISWSVADSSIASVNNNNEIQFIAVGSTMLTGSSQEFSDTVVLTTTAAEPVSVSITGIDNTIAAGLSAMLQAGVVYSDSTTTDISDVVTWSSSDTSVAIVVDGGANNGKIQASEAGFTAITGTHTVDGVSVTGTHDLEVTPSTLRIEEYRDSFFDAGYSDCGSLGSGGDSQCFISSTQSKSVLPAPTWFTLGEFRITAEGRDWTITDASITQFGSAATRVVGLEGGAVISAGTSVMVEVQIQSTGGIQESEIFSVDAVTNNGSDTSAITVFYTITTN